MEQQAVSPLSLYFSPFGVELFIERTQYNYAQWFTHESNGIGDHCFMCFGRWRVLVN